MNGHAFFIAIRSKSLGTLVGAVCLAIVWSMLTSNIRTVTVSITENVAGKVVLVDPGHGGRDPGAIAASGLREKEIVLGIALHLESLLQRAAVNVVMTRRNDTDLADSGASSRKAQDLGRRVALGREAEADVFVSIHGNSFPSATWSGAQTFYTSNRADDRWLAERIQERLVRQLGPNRRQAAAADYYVMRESTMPAVVVEVGFLSSPAESELLGTEAYQRRVAEAIYMGIVDYFALPRPVEAGVEDESSGPVSYPVARSLTLRDDEVLLYFVSPLDEGPAATVHRLPVPVDSMGLEQKIELTLTALLSGPPANESLDAVIPEDVRINSLRIDEGTLFIDFDTRLRDGFTGGAREERLIVDSLLLTLAHFTELDMVHISIAGDSAVSIGGHIFLGDPLPILRPDRP